MREKSLWTFVGCAFVLALPAIIGAWRLDPLALHLAMNRFHSPWADAFFSVTTNFANGWVPTMVALLMLLRTWRAFLMVGLSAGLSAILVQTLKHTFFAGSFRPAMFLNDMPGLQLVQGFELHHYFSFPSGHATTAFSMCLALAVIIGRRVPAALLAVLAAVLAFSRVYLSQHFTEDILAGALIGTLSGVAVHWLLYQGPWARRTRLDRSPFPLRTNTARR